MVRYTEPAHKICNLLFHTHHYYAENYFTHQADVWRCELIAFRCTLYDEGDTFILYIHLSFNNYFDIRLLFFIIDFWVKLVKYTF